MSEFLGGKTALGETQVSITEINSLQELSVGVINLYPINSPEQSLEYRKILINHDKELSNIYGVKPKLEKIFKELGLLD
ncbi:hypothetical protein [Flavobacterium sp.]|uniref:hypothetical protein n=1 Tax=Flavobacterium sp. TaxID=239 RepID=UPI0038FD38DE